MSPWIPHPQIVDTEVAKNLDCRQREVPGIQAAGIQEAPMLEQAREDQAQVLTTGVTLRADGERHLVLRQTA
ncbi:hypothetical protein NDU88_004784 [Pleurodeles waltl]|uniref:Uncharacterized protein n=1 Tax=Pleurodeles waltl TaxID=8319 RepID=A0AAV7PDU4_PLEWA|nr:hypothetical protein NDU88_004784 [Pleurodeles waltl]